MTTFHDLTRLAKDLKQRLAEFSGLDHDIVENIICYAKCLVKPNKKVIGENVFRTQMIEQFNVTNSIMIEHMISVLKKFKKVPFTTAENNRVKGNEVKIPLDEYCKLICVFVSQNLDIKIDWVFRVYDINNDGLLDKIDLFVLLKPCAFESDDMDIEESTKDLIEFSTTLVDLNKNGVIDLEEFRTLVKKNILYIELLGQVLPQSRMIERFLKKIKDMPPSQVIATFMYEKAQSMASFSTSPEPSYYPFVLDIP